VVEVTDHKIVLQMKSKKGMRNYKVFAEAQKLGLPIPKRREMDYKNLNGLFSYHIAHIGDRHLILFDKLKAKEPESLNGEQIKMLFALTKKGMSRYKIAESIGASTVTVWKYQRALELI